MGRGLARCFLAGGAVEEGMVDDRSKVGVLRGKRLKALSLATLRT